MENSRLLRKLANSFALSTGLEFDDLYQEASLAYLEALRTHDPQKGRITTYLWHCVSNRLKSYIKEQEKDCIIISLDETRVNTVSENFFFENLNKEAQEIAKIVLGSPNEFVCMTQKEAKKQIKNMLYNKGWNMRKILNGFKNLQINYSC